MQEHELFEELCALAAAGQISDDDWALLRPHLSSCESCQQLFGSFGRITSELIFAGTLKGEHASNRRVKSATSAPAFVPVFDTSSHRQYSRPANRFLPRIAVAAALVLAIGVGFIAGAGKSLAGSSSRIPSPPPVLISFPTHAVGEFRALESLNADRNRLRAIVEAFAQERDAMRKAAEEKDALAAELRSRISDVSSQLASKTSEADTLQAAREAMSNRIAELDSALGRLRTEQFSCRAESTSQQNAIRQLTERLELERASFHREKALLALGGEGKSIIAARNLHIVDVYDSDGRGTRQKSFGRVFYVEGKDLIFYAYDLPTNRKPTESFHVWGRDAGEQGRVARLGVFHNDGSDERRWVLKVNDAEALANLDSVFVTLERGDKSPKPSGKTLLFAVLAGQPNHS